MVESGNIDLAHHFGWANKALAEVLELEKAVQAAIALLDVKETLLAVTSDHGHTLSITGKPERVMDIRGELALCAHFMEWKSAYTFCFLLLLF